MMSSTYLIAKHVNYNLTLDLKMMVAIKVASVYQLFPPGPKRSLAFPVQICINYTYVPSIARARRSTFPRLLSEYCAHIRL